MRLVLFFLSRKRTQKSVEICERKKRCFLDFFQKSGYNLLTKRKKDVILYKVFARKRKNKIKWPVGQAVKLSCPLRKALIMLFRGELSEMR